MCTNLGTNVFDYGQKYAADKLVQYVGTNYGQDIKKELQNKITVVLVEPMHTNDVLARHSVREVMIRTGQQISRGRAKSKRPPSEPQC
jgi:hypothetical protein